MKTYEVYIGENGQVELTRTESTWQRNTFREAIGSAKRAVKDELKLDMRRMNGMLKKLQAGRKALAAVSSLKAKDAIEYSDLYGEYFDLDYYVED